MSSTQGRVERLESSRSSSITDGKLSERLHYVKNNSEHHEGSLETWIFLMLCVISVSLDPLFFFIPVINDHKSCIALDKKLGVTACVLRSIIDFLYVIFISFQLHADFSTPPHTQNEVGNSDIAECARTVGWKLLRYRMVDFLAVLPLPQVVIIIIIATMRGSKFLNAMKFLKYFVFFQYVPRVIRIYSLFRKATRTLGIFAEATWSKAAFNFLLYMVAGHVYGAFWYFLAVERKIECWGKACKSYTGCSRDSIDCHKNSDNHVFFNDFCSTETQHTKIYDFGIFHDAIQSGILGRRNFVKKFLYCFRWGLQSLSCFGQNLITSTDDWENVFAISITISSVLLFILLIGNMQIFLQVETVRSEEMKLKLREIGQWAPFKTLPTHLQKEVKRYQQHIWRETKGVDVENLLKNLPKDLTRDIKCHLYLQTLMKVRLFKAMGEQYLKEMCDQLKPVIRREGSHIFWEGDQVHEMLFITSGKLVGSTGGSSKNHYYKAGDFCGEELLDWAVQTQSSSNPAISTRTVSACTYVEGFAIMADDLKNFVYQLWRLSANDKRLRYAFKVHSPKWRTWAAYSIQAGWHEHTKKKQGISLQHTLADDNVIGMSPNLGATIYAPRFAVNAPRAMHNSTRETRIRERLPPKYLQKPFEPDFTVEEQ